MCYPSIRIFVAHKKREGSQAHYYTYLSDYEEMLFLLHYLNKGDRFVDMGLM